MEPLPAARSLDAARLGALVTVAFSQRRKLLRHTLGRWIESRAVTPARSTCNAAPRKCRWPNTWRWRGRPRLKCTGKGPAWRPFRLRRPALMRALGRFQAALSHMAVSKALLIIGMFMPKLGLVPFFGTTLGAGLTALALGHFRRPLP
jgi:hypothetical protein